MRSFDEMNKLFDGMNRDIEQIRAGWWAGARPALESGHGHDAEFGPSSAVDEETALSLEEGDDGFVFVMDLPGFEREEIDLTFDDGALSIHASHEVEEGGEDHHTMRSRRIARTVSIPGRVEEAGIGASYRNGVLEVRLPTEDHEDGRRIEIE